MKNWGVILIGVLLTTFGSGRSRPLVYNQSYGLCAQKCNNTHSDCKTECPDSSSHEKLLGCWANCNIKKDLCQDKCKPKVEEKREEEIDFSNFSLWDK